MLAKRPDVTTTEEPDVDALKTTTGVPEAGVNATLYNEIAAPLAMHAGNVTLIPRSVMSVPALTTSATIKPLGTAAACTSENEVELAPIPPELLAIKETVADAPAGKHAVVSCAEHVGMIVEVCDGGTLM